jgi:proteasome lid subunit RPN8/RPN11
MELSDRAKAIVVARAVEEAPEECCGLISQSDAGLSFWPAENSSPDPLAGFEIAPGDLLAILRQIEGREQALVGVYHSHPLGGTDLSPTDVEIAKLWPGLTWVIVSLAGPEPLIGVCKHVPGGLHEAIAAGGRALS